MEYLLKVTAVVTIFYIIYKLFLQRDTFFESNRWFLIIGPISSLLIPFLVIPVYIDYTPISFTDIRVTEQLSTETIEKPFNILDYLPLIYALGVLFFLGRLFIQLLSLIRIIYNNKGIKKDRFIFIETQNNTSPFSFFKWIVYNPEKFNQTELEHIIEHEKTHAKQYHSVDILITQLFCVVLWFNPFMWFYNKDLKQNLEFIADKRTLNQYNCAKSYQYTLLKTSMPSHQMALSNHFYNSLIKKRIVMLHKSKSKKINQLKYALVIPVLALFLMGFNTEEVYVEKTNTNKNDLIPNSKQTLNNPFTFYIMDGTTDEQFTQIKSDLRSKGYTFEISNLKRTKDGLITSIDLSISNESKNANFNTSSVIPIKPIKIELDSSNNSINIGNTSEKIVMGFSSKEKAAAYKKTKTIKNLFSDSVDGAPLFIVDGKQITEEEAEKLSSDNVQAVNVLKDENATKKYGDKGKNGVIEITTKWETNFIVGKTFDAEATEDTLNRIRIRGIGETPLYIINGKEVTEDIVKALNPDNIESVNVLKDEKHTKIYGDKGKNGVVEITLKESIKLNSDIKVTGYATKLDSTTTIRIGHKLDIGKDKHPLILVDGKELPQEEFEKLNPDTVESMTVLKDETATKKYGKKGKNGFIEITTKK
ncbi:M56 family metallopeptidase [Confluentibacter flavum]|uniref:Peptidase M56 domain-containing protein n=1 Tax=Confluentibacter flavum TaxID=1909700 RepID=A0A2N3HMF0_9FLAO|nr:M56 family metallopeptidase [Confluentibacter flavum]PKQ46107.1 hypothetical protein CSW08_05020 [Confluentibacter flavum]